MTSTPGNGRARATAAVGCLLIAALAAACTTVAAQSSPSAAMKAYHQAAKSKDFAALRRLLSAEYLKEFEKSPVSMERILEGLTADVPATLPEMRNETIAGDTATIDVRSHRTQQWESITFVKENGVWKLGPPRKP
jgi:hypothetical protein